MARFAMPIDPWARAIMEVARGAVILVDEDHRIVGVNAPARALFGYEADDFLGLDRAALVAEGDPRFAPALELCARVGRVRVDLSLRRASGERFEATLRIVTVDERGRQCWTVCDAHEPDESGSAEDLRDSNELLRALSDAAFEAVFMHSGGVIRVANRAAELYSGVEPGGLIGRPLVEFIAPESLELTMAKVAAQDDRPYEAFARRADGTIYPVEVHPRTTPVDLGNGPLRVVAMRDMSDRRELEQRLHQAQKLDAIARLAAGVAHDFNNLLAVITSATEVARLCLGDDGEGGEPHPSREALDDVLDAAERAARLVRQLLAFGRQSALQPQLVDAAELIRGLRPVLVRMLGERGTLELALADGPIQAQVDPVQLEQVITNLVVNARDALEPGPGQVCVSVERVELDSAFADSHVDVSPGPHVKIAVADTGVGMDASTVSKIFEPFFTTKSADGGTGLGLATVFGIVRQSGGTIWVDSELGRGTTFTIYLPDPA